MNARSLWNDLLSALGLLSRLPLPRHESRGAEAAWAYPLAGLVLGLIACLAGLLALGLSLPPAAAALICLGTAVALTGALHEDGLADVADGFWGGASLSRRLEIMKDSHIGAYGVVALVLGLLARFTALAALFGMAGGLWAVIAAAVMSRAAMVVLMAALPHARDNGLARSVGQPSAGVALTAALIGAVFAYLCLGWHGSAAILSVALISLGMARLAQAKIGGQTGDLLGATQQVTEIAVLFVAIA
ncbi:cobalamin-5'-phosphate synthase [Pseudooceanicola antarcticus]|uniref:Adenosylcobinamide-GDP ribazoletransferase n=1 Tax=Pseudooceanicola antarcticus TaxID=1247613 RepID=A0A285JGR1_9RHOB|nr:adenosylcobinamide-GDP ribazoletransferase [Pseudooceanicola antarcticus]PJE31011.1 adenosylcobinamide-GDP ribazoletransferase [Pseudooceanicola antarcticus]SNY58977.1 cobalamin-5'-phosphate synthase [Pseudooceanicola antarcticus]